MPLKFTSKEKRDELAERLILLARHMLGSWDQGHDGRVAVTQEMIDDIKTAACVVGLSEVDGQVIPSTVGERKIGPPITKPDAE